MWNERERGPRLRKLLFVAVALGCLMGLAARSTNLIYLLSNAVGFSKANGTVHLTCWREAGQIVFTVEDEGIGIPKDQIDGVFQRFESRSRGSDHRGAGLGLSIVKSLVELHGGSIDITSEEGRGTKVTVRIPERPVVAADGSSSRLAHGGRAA
jgi:signal transduction histidine kinase